jgi:GxxExxY protein
LHAFEIHRILAAKMNYKELSFAVIGAAMNVHKELGPGLLEKAYQECLCYEIAKLGLHVEKEKAMPLVYKGVQLDCGFRLDMLVEDRLVVETKAVSVMNEIHLAQLLSYLKQGNYRLGLLINFNTVVLKNGIQRVVNGLHE